MLAGSASTFLGLDIRVINEKQVLDSLNGPAIFIANHQTSLDAVVLGKVFPDNTGVMAKSTLRYAPLLGQFLILGDNVFITRSRHDSAMETMAQVAKSMKERQKSIFVFVEGTRSHFGKPGLLPFKKGAFQLASQTGYPIVPVVFSDQAPVYHAKKSHLVGGTLRVKFLPPVYAPGVSELDQFIDKVRDNMLQELIEISAPMSKL
jgi:lysophosphatidate acyltransferase